MSVGESFTLLPLSKYFVVKTTTGAGFTSNIGTIQPIASGLIQTDAVNNIGGVSGNYTWYRLAQYGGNPGTQGAELRSYLLVCRGVSTTGNGGSFQLAIPEGGFDSRYQTFTTLYSSMQVTFPGAPGSNTWNFTVAGNFDRVQCSTSTTYPINSESFFFYVMGI
jgi:hypothetical protein